MEKVERNSNIELLRIVLMIMVVTLHFNNGEMGGAFNLVQDDAASKFILYFLESLSICAVNCFMIISGYFLAFNKKVRLGKIVDILLIVIFYRVADYALSIMLGMNSFSVRHFFSSLLPVNYFAIYYIVTYILSPILAKIFDATSEKAQKFFVGASALIFVLWPTVLDAGMDLFGLSLEGLSTISTKGNLAGYSVVQFLFDAVVGMYLRRAKINPKRWKLLLGYFGSTAIMTAGVYQMPSLYNYCSVFTVISAICLFLLFNRLEFQNRAVNFVSKSVFAIFCMHVSSVAKVFWRKFFITSEHITNVWGGVLVLWVFVSVVSMFLLCLLIDIAIRFTFGHFGKRLCSKCPVILRIEE
ncbi:acyltransferase [bacterium]|nr:acyltransferase [bacterium]